MKSTKNDDKNSYEDIIFLERPKSTKHVPMSIHDRAAQFSPFAALSGFEGAIKETARITEPRIELDEDKKISLNETLQQLKTQMKSQQIKYAEDTIKDHIGMVEITYFVPDHNKNGGAYVTVTDTIIKVDEYKRRILLKDGRTIPISELYHITILDANEQNVN